MRLWCGVLFVLSCLWCLWCLCCLCCLCPCSCPQLCLCVCHRSGGDATEECVWCQRRVSVCLCPSVCATRKEEKKKTAGGLVTGQLLRVSQ
ncbi:uncharacterized protein YALI1_F04849g [Yarrowia lipolytica]|uniref:Secreted protein n=1 Tax=Yarrowia lipolytica TaxID=4952 RepID=A0A1D8NLS8_YARLL|nr:hypothetical protein YALI1_F04849g [Yarrowia lipolytica]